MFRIEWYKKDGQWFSTSYVQGTYGFIGSNIRKIETEIKKGEEWWKSPVTWKVFYYNEDVTEQYLELLNAPNPHQIGYGMI